jgi:hypothetical protein
MTSTLKSKRYIKIHCDQCCALVLNGHASHEQGCPNQRKPWLLNEETNRIEPSEVINDVDEELYHE